MNKIFFCIFATLIFFVFIFLPATVFGDTNSKHQLVYRNPGFSVPGRLRGRVDFWKAIFTKYGKHQKVIHHRRFPQITFKVLDFSKAAKELSPNEYPQFVKKVEQEKVDEIKNIIAKLAKGLPAVTAMEKIVEEQMKVLPKGVKKYQDILDKPELIRTQTGIKEKSEEAVERSGKYLKVIEDIFVKEEGLPIELTRLPFIESSFNYTAYSSVGAAGIWQFMPRTAKSYMTVNNNIDERLDPFIATRAATKYLKQAYRSLGEWGLAVTSYNHGIGGVHNKVKSSGTRDIVEMIERVSGDPIFGFASQNFWPEFLAAVEIFDDYKRYYPGISVSEPISATEHKILVPTTINLAAKNHNVSVDELLSVNYAILSPVATGKRPLPVGYTLRVPIKGSRVQPAITPKALPTVKNESKIKKLDSKSKVVTSAQKKPRSITVKSGQTLNGISKLYGVSVERIKKLNNLKNNNIKVGQTLKLE